MQRGDQQQHEADGGKLIDLAQLRQQPGIGNGCRIARRHFGSDQGCHQQQQSRRQATGDPDLLDGKAAARRCGHPQKTEARTQDDAGQRQPEREDRQARPYAARRDFLADAGGILHHAGDLVGQVARGRARTGRKKRQPLETGGGKSRGESNKHQHQERLPRDNIDCAAPAADDAWEKQEESRGPDRLVASDHAVCRRRQQIADFRQALGCKRHGKQQGQRQQNEAQRYALIIAAKQPGRRGQAADARRQPQALAHQYAAQRHQDQAQRDMAVLQAKARRQQKMVVQAQTGQDDARTGKQNGPGWQIATAVQMIRRARCGAERRNISCIGGKNAQRHNQHCCHSTAPPPLVPDEGGLNLRMTLKLSKLRRRPKCATM